VGFKSVIWQLLFGDYPYLTAEGAVLHCGLDASKERREKRKKPFSAFSAQSRAGLPAQPDFTGLWHWACSAVKGNGVEKPAFELVGNHQLLSHAFAGGFVA
jgi:hypothetical protein